jgi:chromosomal replication initiator protein
MSEIISTVCDHYKLSQVDLLSDRRSREVARPRQVAMWLARKLTYRSLPEVARHLRRGDHTTVMHGIKTINHLMRTDEAMVSDIHEIRRRLQTRVMLREAFEQSQVAA